MLDTGLDQPDPVSGILRQVTKRLPHALAHQGDRGEVQHPIPRPLRQHVMHLRCVGKVALNQPGRGRDGRAVPLGQIVEHDNVVAPVKKREHNMAADETSAASHKESLSHRIMTFLNVKPGDASILRACHDACRRGSAK